MSTRRPARRPAITAAQPTRRPGGYHSTAPAVWPCGAADGRDKSARWVSDAVGAAMASAKIAAVGAERGADDHRAGERGDQGRHAAPAEPGKADRKRRQVEQDAGESTGGGRRSKQRRRNEASACADDERYWHLLSLSRLLEAVRGGSVPPQLPESRARLRAWDLLLNEVRQQAKETRTLDRPRKLALLLGGNRGDPARHHLAALRYVTLQQLHVLVIDLRRLVAGGRGRSCAADRRGGAPGLASCSFQETSSLPAVSTASILLSARASQGRELAVPPAAAAAAAVAVAVAVAVSAVASAIAAIAIVAAYSS